MNRGGEEEGPDDGVGRHPQPRRNHVSDDAAASQNKKVEWGQIADGPGGWRGR